MSPKRKRKQRRREKKRKRKEKRRQEHAPPAPPAIPVDPVESPQQADDRQHIANRPDNQDGGNRGSILRSWFGWLWYPSRRTLVIADVVFGGLIALFTGLQVYYGNKQWDATDKQWRTMEQQLQLTQLDQRPWLTIEAKMGEKPEAGKPFDVQYEVRNTGKTPGTITGEVALVIYAAPGFERPGVGRFEIVEDWVHLRLADELLEMLRTEAEQIPTKSVIAPESTRPHLGQHIPRKLEPEEIKAIEDGTMIPIVLGYLVYLDHDNVRHSTQACFQYDRERNRLLPYPEYNHMD